MDADSLVTTLVRIQLVASAAILAVLLLRPLALRWFGAGTAYLLWLVVPLAAVAVLLPAREQVVMLPTAPDMPILQRHIEPAMSEPMVVGVAQEPAAAAPTVRPGVPEDDVRARLLIGLWLLGACVLLVRSILSTRRLASDSSTGPALVGVLRPRLVLPQDFETRFSAEERALILAHEERHRVSRHTLVNALVEVVRCAGWFNPLLHWAAMRFRADQELACDTAIIAAYPDARRTYAEALLKAQGAGIYLPMGCAWNSGIAGRLGERIARLSEQLPGRRRRFAGAAAIVGIGIAASYAAWAQQPARVITMQQPNPESAAASPGVSSPPAREVSVPPPTAPGPQAALSRAVETQPGTSATNGESVLYDAEQLRILSALPRLLPFEVDATEEAIIDYAVKHQEQWLKDAEYRALVLARLRSKFERDYPGLVQKLGLSEMEAQALSDLLAVNRIAMSAKIPVPKIILGKPTREEQMELQDVERRTWELARASRQSLNESLQALLGDKFAQWQAYLRIQQLERSEVTEASLRRSLERYRPSVTADRYQLKAHQDLVEGLQRIEAQNERMRMELEREGLLPQSPLE